MLSDGVGDTRLRYGIRSEGRRSCTCTSSTTGEWSAYMQRLKISRCGGSPQVADRGVACSVHGIHRSGSRLNIFDNFGPSLERPCINLQYLIAGNDNGCFVLLEIRNYSFPILQQPGPPRRLMTLLLPFRRFYFAQRRSEAAWQYATKPLFSCATFPSPASPS